MGSLYDDFAYELVDWDFLSGLIDNLAVNYRVDAGRSSAFGPGLKNLKSRSVGHGRNPTENEIPWSAFAVFRQINHHG